MSRELGLCFSRLSDVRPSCVSLWVARSRRAPVNTPHLVRQVKKTYWRPVPMQGEEIIVLRPGLAKEFLSHLNNIPIVTNKPMKILGNFICQTPATLITR